MKKSRKIISILLALLLVTSIGAVMLISNAEDNSRNTTITVTVDKSELKAGESATVTVKATTNYAVGTMSIPVFYDKTLVEIGNSTTPLNYENKTVTTDLTAIDTKKIYADTGVDSNKFGFVLVNYIAGAGDTVETILTDAVVITFSVTAKADVRGEAVIKVVTESAKTEKNTEGMLYFGAQPDGNTVNAIPENVEGVDVTNAVGKIKIYNGSELEVSEYGASMGVVVDKVSFNANGNGFVYGINTDMGEMIESYFETPAGSVVVTPNAMGAYSTGSTIELLDDSGVVVETYHFIFLGDVNGDGYIDAADTSLVDGIANYIDWDYMGGDGTCESMAMDINGDGYIDAADTSLVDGVANYIDFPTQAELAANVAAMKGI